MILLKIRPLPPLELVGLHVTGIVPLYDYMCLHAGQVPVAYVFFFSFLSLFSLLGLTTWLVSTCSHWFPQTLSWPIIIQGPQLKEHAFTLSFSLLLFCVPLTSEVGAEWHHAGVDRYPVQHVGILNWVCSCQISHCLQYQFIAMHYTGFCTNNFIVAPCPQIEVGQHCV